MLSIWNTPGSRVVPGASRPGLAGARYFNAVGTRGAETAVIKITTAGSERLFFKHVY